RVERSGLGYRADAKWTQKVRPSAYRPAAPSCFETVSEIGHFRPVFGKRDRFRGPARMFVPRRAVTPDAGYGEVGVKVDLLVPNHRGRPGEAAMVAARNYR
ncbi:MAG TPA: hypothetical protein VGC79_34935, partial [Polyangiaceae bacterium]